MRSFSLEYPTFSSTFLLPQPDPSRHTCTTPAYSIFQISFMVLKKGFPPGLNTVDANLEREKTARACSGGLGFSIAAACRLLTGGVGG